MADVEIGLGAIFGHVDFTVLERVHGARIDVDVRVKLLLEYLDTTAAQQTTQRRGSQTLTEIPSLDLETTPPVTKICLVTCS